MGPGRDHTGDLGLPVPSVEILLGIVYVCSFLGSRTAKIRMILPWASLQVRALNPKP